MTDPNSESVLSQLGIEPHRVNELSRRDRWGFLERWRGAFIPEYELRTSGWPAGETPWDLLGLRCVESLSGAKADEAFQETCSTVGFVVVAELSHSVSVYLLQSDEGLMIDRLRSAVLGAGAFIDLCCGDRGMTWSYVLTHEDVTYFMKAKSGKP